VVVTGGVRAVSGRVETGWVVEVVEVVVAVVVVTGTVVVGEPNTPLVISGWIRAAMTNNATTPASAAPTAIQSVRRVHVRSGGWGVGFHSSGLGGSSGSTG
jgi:hypothetical protein